MIRFNETLLKDIQFVVDTQLFASLQNPKQSKFDAIARMLKIKFDFSVDDFAGDFKIKGRKVNFPLLHVSGIIEPDQKLSILSEIISALSRFQLYFCSASIDNNYINTIKDLGNIMSSYSPNRQANISVFLELRFDITNLKDTEKIYDISRLFHVTSSSRLDEIMNYGLKPQLPTNYETYNSQKLIYFMSRLIKRFLWYNGNRLIGQLPEVLKDAVLLAIDFPKDYKYDLYLDPNAFSEYSLISANNVSPEFIKIVPSELYPEIFKMYGVY